MFEHSVKMDGKHGCLSNFNNHAHSSDTYILFIQYP